MVFRQTGDTADDALETGGRVPAYISAVASVSQEQAETLAHLTRSVLFGGTLPPPLKLAMGMRVAELTGATYAGTHFRRLARATPATPIPSAQTVQAMRYATNLTRDVHGVSDADFAQVKSQFNDAQLVELTMVTCFFNYFTRLTMGLGLTPEPWQEMTKPRIPAPKENPYAPARVALVSDEELKTSVEVQERFGKNPGTTMGLGVANSLRAMIHVPDMYDAWIGRQFARPPATAPLVPRTTLLQVSLAVSTVNGCRYCVLHQVLGLRRQGVEVGKLLALQKDDSALTPEEKAAVDFARKLTKTPATLTPADRAALASAFPGKAAFEVLRQTCVFAFMNRFTDGLRLPSEDEAVKIYQETYGRAFPERPYK